MPRVVRSTIIDAPVERLWAVLRDFNGHESWHPIVAKSTIERGYPSDKIGCVRRFTMQDGAELREQLLAPVGSGNDVQLLPAGDADSAVQLRRPCPAAAGHRRQSQLLALGGPVHHAGRARGGARRAGRQRSLFKRHRGGPPVARTRRVRKRHARQRTHRAGIAGSRWNPRQRSRRAVARRRHAAGARHQRGHDDGGHLAADARSGAAGDEHRRCAGRTWCRRHHGDGAGQP